MSQTPSEQYRVYNAWDAPTRWFHWINALAVLGLISVGVMLLNDDALGLSAGGKVQLKQIQSGGAHRNRTHTALKEQQKTATGLILAGTDLFWPPFGGWFAGWVAATGIDPASVSPLASDTMDQAAYKAMRAFRLPIVTIHLYAFNALAAVILTHLAAVIVTEIHEGGSITSAMFTGRKILNRLPQDV